MPQFIKQPTITTLRVNISPESKIAFVNWQAKLNAVITGFPGFISLEFLSSPDQQEAWTVVQRFYDAEKVSSWRASKQHMELMDELRSLVADNDIKETTGGESNSGCGVTEVIVTQVNPGNEKAYRDWSAKIHQIEAKFPGFRGVYLQSPTHSQGRNWITLLQFDTPENLDHWLTSTERQKILNESVPLITSLESHRVVSPYAGWFASIAKSGEAPPVWKQTMIVLLVLFPIVMLELKYLSPWTANLGGSLSTFIGNALSVTLISFPMMPIAIWFLGWWLSPGNEKRLQKTVAGSAIVFLLYLIEVLIFNASFG